MSGTKVSDAGLHNFKDLKAFLFLNNTSITDAGLAHLKDCKNLTGLHLNDTGVTNAGVADSKDCKNLTMLHLYGTKITASGIDELKKALPRCRIAWEGGIIEAKPYSPVFAKRGRPFPLGITE